MLTLKEYIQITSHSALAISRANMPQINNTESFLSFLDERNIVYTQYNELDIQLFEPTQQEFDVNKVNSIISSKQIKTPIIVSSDRFVVDGHHRYFAALETNTSIPVIQVELDLMNLLKLAYEYVDETFSPAV